MPLRIRCPLAMQRRILEAEPRPTNPLADVNIRLEAIRSLEQQIRIDWHVARYAVRMHWGAVAYRPTLGALLAGLGT